MEGEESVIAFKCDICGAYYEPYGYFGNQSDEEPNSFMLYAKHEIGGDGCMTRYDVCPACMNAVKELFEKRKALKPYHPPIGNKEDGS